ncbi:MAG TPA: response regulator [Patescibacteria group bacterium]|nr:response regulator [Patescibacteria group bacterium]
MKDLNNPDKKVILVIEDEAPLLEAIKRKLELGGSSVLTATTTEQALSYLQDEKRIDLIWLDHYIFGKEPGLLFVAELKNSPKWKSIPIFVVSNAAGAEKKQAYLSLGVDKYYAKVDYRLDQLVKDIQIFLAEKKE